MKRFQYLLSRFGLVAVGVAFGLLARVVIGPPGDDRLPKRVIDRPLEQAPANAPDNAWLPLDFPIDEPETR